MKQTKNIAFLVSENKKSELIEWSYFNRKFLLQHEIIATGPAIKILEGTLNKPVNQLISGPFGGLRMMSELMAEGKIDVLVFFASDETTHKDFDLLIESAKNNNVIVAFNKSTADFIFNSPLMQQEYFVKIPYSQESKKLKPVIKKGKVKTLPQIKVA